MLRYFSGELLDASAFELEQEYVRRLRREGRPVLVIEIDAGDGFELWEEVAELTASGPDDRHFVVDVESGCIRFGDGSRGRRPPSGSRVRGRYGSGSGASRCSGS